MLSPSVPWRRTWPRPARLARQAHAVPAWLPGLLAAVLCTAPAWLPFLRPDLSLWRLYDGDIHLSRAFLLGQMLAGGDWYPRWLPQQYGGYGYPTFTFYAPALYYVMWLAAKALPGGLYTSFQVIGAAGALSAVGATYALAWRLWRHGPAGLVAAGAVAYGPYLLPLNLYLNGALPQVLGFGLTVWLLVLSLRLWQHVAERGAGKGWWWSVAGLTAALLLTHNISAALAAVVLAGWIGCLWLWRPSWRAAQAVVSAGLLGSAVTAFLWLPALVETGLVQVERMHRGNLHYRNWFLSWPGYHSELWGLQSRSPWTPGFPIDLHLAYPNVLYGPPKLSLWQGALLVMSTLGLAAAVRRGTGREAARFTQHGRLALWAAFWGLAVSVLCYAQSFDWALPWWDRFVALRSIQFPFRLLGVVDLGIALAAGGALALWTRPSRACWAAAAAVMAAIALAGTANRPVPVAPGVSRAVDLAHEVARQRTLPEFTASTGEFLPKTADFAEWHEGEARGFWLYERMFPEASWLGGRVLVWRGNVAMRALDGGALWTSADVVVDGSDGGTIAFHQLAFPGWRAWVDGRAAPTRPAPWIESEAIQPGFLLVDVPPGPHRVAIRFGADGPRLAGALVSLVTLGLIALGVSWRARRTPERVVRIRSQLGAAGLAVSVLLASVRLVAPLRPPHPRGASDALVVANVLDAARSGQVAVSAPTGAALGLDKYVDARYVTVLAQDRPLRDAGPRPRRWLFMHPPSEVALDLKVPPGAYFQTSLALDPAMWDALLGDGVRFVASVTPQGGQPVNILDGAVNPRARGEHRRWVDVVADLRPWAGQRVHLTLRTDPREDPANDWAGWAEPVVVRLDPLTADRLLRSSAAIQDAVFRS